MISETFAFDAAIDVDDLYNVHDVVTFYHHTGIINGNTMVGSSEASIGGMY